MLAGWEDRLHAAPADIDEKENLDVARIGTSELNVHPLCLGGNVFGWTADRDESVAILDAFHEGGGDFIDTADSYSAWVPGHTGGESETIIGEWLAARGHRDVVVATKVSQHPQFTGLSAANVRAAAEASLQRLGVSEIDLYYAHFDDADTPLVETVEAFGALVADGLVRNIAVSNYSADRIREWFDLARAGGFALPVAVQPHYNLVERGVEADVLPLAEAEGMSVVPYFSLAKGFLAGKYRAASDADAAGASPRAKAAASYATPEGLAVVDELERIAAAHDASIASTALAWLRSRPGVIAPLASASRVDQVDDLLASATLDLTPDEIAALDAVSAAFAR